MPQEGLRVDYLIVPSNQFVPSACHSIRDIRAQRARFCVAPVHRTGSWAQTAARGRNKAVVLPVLCDQGSFDFMCDVRVASLNSVGNKRLQTGPKSRDKF